MKYTLILPIARSRAEVWKVFDDFSNIKKWQPTLIKLENLSGTPRQIGALSRFTYSESGRKFFLTEKVTFRAEPDRFDSIFENDFADNYINNTFIATSEHETLWKMEVKFKFKTLLMKIVGPLMKKNYATRTEKDMARFKELVEKP